MSCRQEMAPPQLRYSKDVTAHPIWPGVCPDLDGTTVSPPPVSSSLTHTLRMDGFCNHNADKLGSLAGLSLLTVYVSDFCFCKNIQKDIIIKV